MHVSLWVLGVYRYKHIYIYIYACMCIYIYIFSEKAAHVLLDEGAAFPICQLRTPRPAVLAPRSSPEVKRQVGLKVADVRDLEPTQMNMDYQRLLSGLIKDYWLIGLGG